MQRDSIKGGDELKAGNSKTVGKFLIFISPTMLFVFCGFEMAVVYGMSLIILCLLGIEERKG
jgi:formate/nitrite transporter FocA (FNT family)